MQTDKWGRSPELENQYFTTITGKIESGQSQPYLLNWGRSLKSRIVACLECVSRECLNQKGIKQQLYHGESGRPPDQVHEVLICSLLAPNLPSFPATLKLGLCKLHFSLPAGQQGPLKRKTRLEETICVPVWPGSQQHPPRWLFSALM